MAKFIAIEGGKPIKDAYVEVDRAISTLKEYSNLALNLTGEQTPMNKNPASANRLAVSQLEPIGPVLALCAFNHPVNLVCHQVGSAIAAACPVILKPSDATFVCAQKMTELFYEAGLPEDMLKCFICSIDAIEKMVSDPRIRFISFIGSGQVGWKLRSMAHAGTRLALEHGGEAAALVLEDSDIEKVAASLVKSSFYHAGQVCISTQRIYVPKSIFKKFKEEFIKKTKSLKVSDATNESTDVGPLIRSQSLEKIEELIKETKNAGLEPITGGKKIMGQFFEPTVYINPSPELKIVSEEVFGPIVSLIEYNSIKEVLDLINDTRSHFQHCIYGNNSSQIMKLADSIDAACVVLNDHNAYRVDWMPFGGHLDSGLGLGGCEHSVRDMSRAKLKVLNYS